MSSKKMIGVTLAAAATLAFAVAPVTSFAKATKVKCYNVKGSTEAVLKTEKQCKRAGGTTTAPAATTGTSSTGDTTGTTGAAGTTDTTGTTGTTGTTSTTETPAS